MRKDKVWKQVLALVLSAALVVGNGSSVSAATGDPAADNGTSTIAVGTADSTQVVTNQDAYKKVAFDFEDGQMLVSGDDSIYVENGIQFANECSVPVVTDDNGNPVASEENPNKSEGVELISASEIPNATQDDKDHGKVLKFDTGKHDVGVTGIDYLTSTNGAFASYDYSNGVIFSFDIRPEAGQVDWTYLFAFGQFYKYNTTGTLGFIAGYEAPWTFFTPVGNFLPGNNVNDDYNYFKSEEHANKWYTMGYVYTEDGMTITVDGVPVVTYKDHAGKMGDILKNMSQGQLRLGKGIVPTLEGFIGYMDNVTIQPVHAGAHSYEDKIIEEKKATCVENGYEKRKCSMCGVIDIIERPAEGHDFDGPIPAKDPTCTEKGNVEYYTCKKEENSYFVSGDDGVKKVAKSKIEIKAKGHSYGSAVVTTKATPDKDGVMTSVCSACPEGTEGHAKTEVINKVSSITLAGTSFAHTGKAITPAVTVKDSKGTVIAAANYTVSYSNNINPGTATAKITFQGDKYTGSVDKTFTITAATAADLTLDKSAVTLYTGKASKTATVKATVTGASKTVTWKSSNDKIAKVDASGKITAVKKGTATVTATANGISKSVKVTVKNPTVTVKKGKKSVKSVAVSKKKTVKLTVSVNPKNSGIKMGKLSKKQKKIANITLKKGKLTIKGKKKGTVKVKITSGKATKTITVKVK